ncbi:MAG: alpha/beta hydrolase [Flavobacteriaceae bacterium]|nr:alpha/beta hydrolase [Flavobacteriaceae bacterium]
MKKLLFLFLLINISLQAQEYALKENISYYNDSINESDIYIKERCVLDLYYPKDKKDFATIVWFHGGGLKAFQKEIPEYLKNKGFAVVGVNYRLSPRAKSPAYVEDAAAAISWVFKNITKYGGNSSMIFVSGHSAGGYLALMTGLDKRWLAANGTDANSIAGLIPISGQTITHSTIREEQHISPTIAVVDSMAPLNHIRPDAPPLLLITGDRNLEMAGRYEENALLAAMMKAVGHPTVLYELQGYTHMVTEAAFPLLVKEVNRIIKEKQKMTVKTQVKGNE